MTALYVVVTLQNDTKDDEIAFLRHLGMYHGALAKAAQFHTNMNCWRAIRPN
jgi:hypothetical protein